MRPRTRTVLAALGVQRENVASRDLLAEAVWGERPPMSWPEQVQICIWDLRKTLGAGVVLSADGGYRLSTAAELDVDRFEALARRGHDLAGLGEAV